MSTPLVSDLPFPHFVSRDLWEDAWLDEIVREFPKPDHQGWRRYGGENEIKYEGGRHLWGPATHRYFYQLENMAPMFSHLFGIDGLSMEAIGGGYHLIPPGGRLALHTDFNRSPLTGLYRRLNVLTFLNRDWDDPGGTLELGLPDDYERNSVKPEFNTTVAFETSDRSWHGHPEPTQRQWRRSVAAYFFSEEPPPGYTGDHSTVWADDARGS